MSFKSEQQRRTVMALISSGFKTKKKPGPSKTAVRVAAKRQGTTQRFQRKAGKMGLIANPAKLALGQIVYRLLTDTTTKTPGTKGDKWVKGKVIRKKIIGRRTPAVEVVWEIGRKWKPKKGKKGTEVVLPRLLTLPLAKQLSIMQIGGLFTRKSGEQIAAEKRPPGRRGTMTVMRNDPVPPPSALSYSTTKERREKTKKLEKEHPVQFGRSIRPGERKTGPSAAERAIAQQHDIEAQRKEAERIIHDIALRKSKMMLDARMQKYRAERKEKRKAQS